MTWLSVCLPRGVSRSPAHGTCAPGCLPGLPSGSVSSHRPQSALQARVAAALAVTVPPSPLVVRVSVPASPRPSPADNALHSPLQPQRQPWDPAPRLGAVTTAAATATATTDEGAQAFVTPGDTDGQHGSPKGQGPVVGSAPSSPQAPSALRRSLSAALGPTLGVTAGPGWASSGEEGEVEVPYQVAVRGLTPGAVASVSVHSRTSPTGWPVLR